MENPPGVIEMRPGGVEMRPRGIEMASGGPQNGSRGVEIGSGGAETGPSPQDQPSTETEIEALSKQREQPLDEAFEETIQAAELQAATTGVCCENHHFSRMSIHRFDHVDLRVCDFAEARKFYDVFLPALGFPKIRAGKTEVSYYAEGERKTSPFIGLNEERGHRGDASRIAFWADTEEEVNRLGRIIREAGAQNVEGPEYCHGYTPGYYAVFFEDADGNKWEICCRNARVRRT